MLSWLLPLLVGQTLSGTVESRGTRDALPGAVISFTDGGVIAETDAEGRFALPLDAGAASLTITATGHQRLEVTEQLSDGVAITVTYRLERTSNDWETTVRARRDEGGARIELSRTELTETAGTQGDPFKVVMSMPGVASIASGLSYPVVRGAQPAATGFFLDGVRLPQLYHLLAGPAVVHPDFIERVDFFPGVLPARYGRLLGGAIDGRIAKVPDRLRINVSVDVLNASAFVATPIPIPGAPLDVTLAGRVSYAGPIAAAAAKALIQPFPGQAVPTPVVNFADYQGRFEWRVGEGRVRVLVLGVVDEAGTKENGPGTVTALLSSKFHRLDLAYRQSIARGTFEAGVLMGTEELGLLGERDGQRYGQFLMTRDSLQLRTRWNGPLTDTLTFETGLELERQLAAFQIDRDPSATTGPAASFREPRSTGSLAAAFAQLSWKPGRFSGDLGVRVDGYFLEQGVARVAPELRLIGRVALLPGLGVRAGASLVHQAPTVLINLPITDLAGLRDGLQQALKFEAGADAELPFDFEATGSVFWNQITRPLESSIEDLLNNRERLSAVATAGRSYGVELMVRRRPIGNWFGWIAYTFQRSERLKTVYDFGTQGEVLGSRDAWVPFDFDQAHVLHVTGGVVLPWKLHFSVGVHVNTGRPESGVVSSRALRPGLEPGTLLPGWVPVSLTDEPRLPAYARVDARISRTFTFDAFTLEAWLDALNASATSEIYAYTYGSQGVGTSRTLTKQPFSLPVILPFLGVKGRY